jgi:phosphotransferase family enzyme
MPLSSARGRRSVDGGLVTTRLHAPSGKLLEDEAFVREHVWLRVLRARGGAAGRFGYRLTLHRSSRGRRHAVAEYTFDPSTRVVAKLYPDGDEGHRVYEILRTLHQHDFGSRAAYRVPEPIAYLPNQGVLLMERADGDRLTSLESTSPSAFREGLGSAARWLAALHDSPVRVGPREDGLRDAFRLSRRIARASRCRPDLAQFFERAIREITRWSGPVTDPAMLVQSHRRYQPSRVFLTPEHVTVTGLDRAAVGDPMKDVGEFIHRLRWSGVKAGLRDTSIEESTHVFLEAYARTAVTDRPSLPYQWQYAILWTLSGLACSRGSRQNGLTEHWDRTAEDLFRVAQLAAEWTGRTAR